MNHPDEELFEAALTRIHFTDPEWGLDGQPGQLANHAPMACESLLRLGHAAAMTTFLDKYLPLLQPLRAGRELSQSETRAARGQTARIGDLVVTYQARIDERGPFAVLRDALPDLVPGLMAGAMHGLLRVAHIARALGQHDSPVRRVELAHALAYWTGAFQSLGPLDVPRGGVDIEDTLRLVPLVPQALRGQPLITERVLPVAQLEGFAAAVAGCDPGALPLDAYVRRVTRWFAPRLVVMDNARFTYLHAITGTSALRLLAPYLDEPTRVLAQRYAFQAVCALKSAHDPHSGVTLSEPDSILDLAPLIQRAVQSHDDHSIKLAEVVSREDALAVSPELRHALSAFLAR